MKIRRSAAAMTGIEAQRSRCDGLRLAAGARSGRRGEHGLEAAADRLRRNTVGVAVQERLRDVLVIARAEDAGDVALEEEEVRARDAYQGAVEAGDIVV